MQQKSGVSSVIMGFYGQKWRYLIKKGDRGYLSFLGTLGERLVTRPALMRIIGLNCHKAPPSDRGEVPAVLPDGLPTKNRYAATRFLVRLLRNPNLIFLK